jgi:hypothetical protein
MKATIPFASCLLLAACATSPMPTEQTRLTTNVLDQHMTSFKEKAGQLTIKRDPGLLGSACAMRVLIGGKPLAELWPAERITAFLPPGEYVVSVQSTGVCGGGDAEAGVTLTAEQAKTYRISIDEGMSIRVAPTAF